ncbi:hypothetical protein BDD12DRAFT_808227 [Trichophaea hybrida]|nr:hypothetical protein BDD12DRAFT_808227 [Trichophaea hybrida]
MAEQANTNAEELSQRKRELAEAIEKLEEYKKQVTGNMEEIKKAKEQLQQAQEAMDQLTEAAKEGSDGSKTIARLQKELKQSKRENRERMTQELMKFSEQLANQTASMMDVIKQMLEKITTTRESKADKCGCTLNAKEREKFNGKNPEDFLPWFTRVDNYVGEQLHRIATARDVRVIMFSLLDENSLEYAIESCLRGQPIPNMMGEGGEVEKKEEYEAIMTWLTQNFSDTLLTQKLIATGNNATKTMRSSKQHVAIKEIKDHGTYAELRQKCLVMDGYLPPGEKYRGRGEQRKEIAKGTETVDKYTPAQLEKLKEKAKGIPWGPAASCRLWGGSEIDPTGRRGQGGRRDRKVKPADRDGRGEKHKNGSKERRRGISYRYKWNRSLDRLRGVGQHLHKQDGPETPTP